MSDARRHLARPPHARDRQRRLQLRGRRRRNKRRRRHSVRPRRREETAAATQRKIRGPTRLKTIQGVWRCKRGVALGSDQRGGVRHRQH